MKIVISGATGAIGHALIAECIKQNIEVVVLSHRTSKRISKLTAEVAKMLEMKEENVKRFLSIWYIDLSEYGSANFPSTDTENLKYTNCDMFFHLAWNGTVGAARNDKELQEKNIEYALDAVKLAHMMGCHTFVGAGSQAEYGRVEGKLTATIPEHPENEYGKAKLAAGINTRVLCYELNMRHIWPRILSVYGPYDTENSMVMSAIIKLRNKEIPKFTKGEQQWDFLYSMDAAKALLGAGKRGQNGTIYPIGCGYTKPLSEYIEIIRKETDEGGKVDLGAIPYAEKQVMYLCADIDQLSTDTGFKPETEFEEGIRQILRIQFDKNDK